MIYQAKPNTMEYTGNAPRQIKSEDKNPMYDPKRTGSVEFLLPKFETFEVPLPCGDNEVNILQPDKTWKIEKDYRKTYWEQDGTEKEITEIGVEIPPGCIDVGPENKYHTTHDGTNWIVDYYEMRKDKLSEAKRARKDKEISGVNITGVSCEDFYLETDEDGQTKIFGAVTIAAQDLASSLTTKWKTLSGWREVKNSDIIIMGLTVRSHINNTFKKLEVIEEEINQLNNSELSGYVINFSQ